MEKKPISQQVKEAAETIERILDELEGTERELFLAMLKDELKQVNKPRRI